MSANTAPHYYNEIDPFAAQWLRNLIAAGHLPAGDVDERSIVDVRPDDLKGCAAFIDAFLAQQKEGARNNPRLCP